MKYFLLTLVSITLFSLPASAYTDSEIRVVVFGDSLVSGYQLQPQEAFPVKLEAKLKEIGFSDFRVINMATSSDSTTDALGRLNDLLIQRPDIVVIGLGLNDIMRGVSADLMYRNIAYIAAQLKQKNIYVVLMGVQAPAGRGPQYELQISTYFAAIAKNYGLPFYPNALEGIFAKPQYNLADGYRPNAQGVDIIVEGMYRLVDAGMRWKLGVLQYQEQYRKSMAPQQHDAE